MNENERLALYTDVKPSRVQEQIQRMGFNVFIHYGINTFGGKEWSDGTIPASAFNPTEQNTDSWLEVISKTGAKGVILTCKHHDGFCLWPTKTTEYCVRNSPYKDGKGDVVREVSDSCKKYGLKFGIYLSPWDRNSEYYGTDKYNDFYIEQLTELLTGYGDIFCVWLDGACGSYMDGKPRQVYDFPRIYDTVRRLQKDAVISNCGPDVRWVGNEAGQARESEWNVVPAFSFDVQKIADNSQQADDAAFRRKPLDVVSEDLGSREVLADYNDFIWYPAEVDVSIRPGWFYHKSENGAVRSVKNLTYIYYTSVGGNSLLLLNVPPDRRGLIHEKDAAALLGLGETIRNHFSQPVRCTYMCDTEDKEHPASNLGSGEGYFTSDAVHDSYTITMKFDSCALVDKVVLKEDCRFSQRIEDFDIYAMCGAQWVKACSYTTVGYNRIAVFRKPMDCTALKLVINSCRLQPYLESVIPYRFNGKIPRAPWYAKIHAYFSRLGYKLYVKRAEKQKLKQAKKQQKNA